ncbi:rCG28592 [Rattus norvegicus]|uniref:RCG28592 n=1 Tax=Rattus norvegicus TaxID=10116 RepID=A6HW26_RAT|nr:rCG28592 [Rattus norvegicus]
MVLGTELSQTHGKRNVLLTGEPPLQPPTSHPQAFYRTTKGGGSWGLSC